MALAALRRRHRVICRAAQQSLSTISSASSSSSQHRFELFGHGQECNPGYVAAKYGSESGRVSFPSIFSNGGFRSMSGIRSKVERRMRKETGRTLREIRRAKKLRKKLMTEEERLIFSLRRAKKKVALLLQKLKKYELPELPPPRHDPELLTPEQLQALRKIGFRNKNYVPVGVRGVFGGVVQNMHLHWKFHETVQVCCDNFPKEKIKDMAIMLARLSGGTVINIHDVKTIIMYRGRNYRQPKVLIPVNTLTKRKALFKARFEQALESQKINIKQIEQHLRRMGVNPEDPIAMASVQKVASTFFRAIDEKQGSPYVFHGDKDPLYESDEQEAHPAEDSDQEELDRFIAEIENAADDEWAAEEAAEKEEAGKIRYWDRPNGGNEWGGGDMPDKGRRDTMNMEAMDSEDDVTGDNRGWVDTDSRNRRSQRESFEMRRKDQRSSFDRGRSGQRGGFDKARRNKDENDDWDSEDEVVENGSPGMRNMDDDWDTDDEDTFNSRKHEHEGEDSDSEEIDYGSNRRKAGGRSHQKDMIARTGRGQTYSMDRSKKGKGMEKDLDSEDDLIDSDQYSEDETSDKGKEHKDDMYDNWSSEEEVDCNTKRGKMVMHDNFGSGEDVVGRGRRQGIDGETDGESEDSDADIHKRKKHNDKNGNSD